MRKRKRFAGFVILPTFFLLSAGFATPQENEVDYAKVLTVLFPETESWVPLNQMRQLGREDVKKIEPELREAYFESRISKGQEGKECSFISRLFSTSYEYRDNWKCFQQFDVDADGTEDVVYSGPSLCFNGNSTIIWFGGRGGFTIKQTEWWPVKALRIAPGKPAMFGSVTVSCCAEVIDEYSMGNFENIRHQGPRRIPKGATIPSLAISPLKFSAPDQELVLRASPEINDKYNEALSGLMSNAVFGNVLSKYLPGCTGTIVGRNKDGSSDLWYFILLDEACELLRTHSPYCPYEANAGWVKASSVKPVR
jgi:hypothetical protein